MNLKKGLGFRVSLICHTLWPTGAQQKWSNVSNCNPLGSTRNSHNGLLFQPGCAGAQFWTSLEQEKMNLNKWQSHVNGIQAAPKDYFNRIPNAYTFAFSVVVKWVSDKIENTNKQVFYRTLSPRHFQRLGHRRNMWYVTFFDKNVTMMSIWYGLGRDLVVEKAPVGTNLQLLNITLLSQLPGEAHISTKYGGGKQHATQDLLTLTW
jgi:hypothetical protein